NSDNCWLGWFCVDEEFRGQGLGKKLLDFSMLKAKELNKKSLQLYTYQSPEFEAAINMYRKYNFTQYTPSRECRKKDLYFQIFLDDFFGL
ncbi:MAG: GNAT family N-acetyltransferase, partial [Campylobacterota bacterium]|nr:GNAT family N-acetyltransferase [Campylobacterota bacterium]